MKIIMKIARLAPEELLARKALLVRQGQLVHALALAQSAGEGAV